LGESLKTDKARGVQEVAAEALGEMNSLAASKQLISALDVVKEPSTRAAIVQALGSFKESPEITAKLETIAHDDSSYRARAAALGAIGRMKTPNAYDILTAAVAGDSPDGFLRNAALRGFGPLGNDKAVPLLREWAAPGKEIPSRQAAISSLARLDKNNKDITTQIASYLTEPHFLVRFAAIFALGSRGDASAIPALEALLNSNDLSIEMAPRIKRQIEILKNPKGGEHGNMGEGDEPGAKVSEDQRLAHVEKLVEEMNQRLKTIEGRLPATAAAKP